MVRALNDTGRGKPRRSWHRSCVGVEAHPIRTGAVGGRLATLFARQIPFATCRLLPLGTPHDDYRSGRTRGDSPGIKSQQQEAGAAGTGGAGSNPVWAERALDFRSAVAAGEVRDDGGRIRRCDPARQTSQAGKDFWPVRAAGTPDRFRGDGRSTGRSRLFAAGAGRRRRRSPESTRTDRAAVARPGCGEEAEGLARGPGDLFGAGAAAGERRLNSLIGFVGKRAGSARSLGRRPRLIDPFLSPAGAFPVLSFSGRSRGLRRQCTLTACSSLLQAFATAASRESVSMIGVPSAAWSANSFSPGAIFGACGNRSGTSSDRICFT